MYMMRHLYLNCVQCYFFAAMISMYLYQIQLLTQGNWRIYVFYFTWKNTFEYVWYLLCTFLSLYDLLLKVHLPAVTSFKVTFPFPKMEVTNKPWKGHQLWGHSLPKTIISPERWWLEEEISYWNGPFFNGHLCFWGVFWFLTRRLPARLQRAKQRSSWANGPTCNSVCGRHGTLGRGDGGGPELVRWLGFWGWLVCCLTWDNGFMSGNVMKVFLWKCVKLVLGGFCGFGNCGE